MGVTHTPDVLVGLGGGGGRVVTRFLRQDWLLDDVLDSDGGDEPGKLRATIVDSEFREAHPTAAITERIEAAKDRAGLPPTEDTLSFEGRVVVPEQLPDRWLSRQLLPPGVVADLCQRQGLHSWWLADDRGPMASALDLEFADGTFRCRPLGKALYHLAMYTDVRLVPPTTNTDEVAFVTALGGGTGSGMALDLAAGVDSRRTHLYAILPHEGANAREKANAFAALSELAYAHHAGESPFDTVILLPHLDGVDTRAFETAAVRSILAHQQAVQGGPAPWNAGPNAEPFTVAAPHTVEFPIEYRREATEAVRELLTAKQTELEVEADLHAHVRTYLRECFPDTAGAAFADASTFPEHAPTPFELRDRIEALRERLLGSDALDLIGTVDQVELIRETVDAAFEDVQHQTDAEDEPERIRQYVETAPELLIGALDADAEQFDLEPLPDELVQTLRAALANVAKRRDLLDAVAHVTEESGLGADDAELVRELLQQDVLDPETTYPTGMTNVEERIAELEAEAGRLATEREELESFHESVAAELDTRLDHLFDESREALRTVAAINEHGETIPEEIDDLEGTVADAVRAVEAANTAEAASAVTLDLGRFEPLNARLSEMGIAPVPLREIENAFDRLREARVALIDYQSGFLSSILHSDLAAEYEDHAAALTGTDWLDIGPPTVDSEEPFHVEFSAEPLRRTDEIGVRRDDATERVVDAFTALFDGDDPLQFGRAVGESTRISVPESTDRPAIEAELREALERSHAEETDALFGRLFPREELRALERTAAPDAGPAAALHEAYLLPVREAHKRTVGRLHAITGDDAERSTGTLERLDLLRELAVGDSASAASIPDPDSPGDPVSGVEFADRYEGRYESDLAAEFDIAEDDDPYVIREPIDWDGPVPDPAALDETALVAEQIDRLTDAFADFADSTVHGDERAPVAPLRDASTMTGDLEVRSVFLSNGAPPGSENLRTLDDVVAEQVRNGVTIAGGDGLYASEAFATGRPAAVTVAAFLDGLAFDDLELVGGPDGYRAVYERERDNEAFPGVFHAIGLGGDWATWETLGEWLATVDADDYGGYVYRNTLLAGDRDSRLDLFSAGVSESTVSLD